MGARVGGGFVVFFFQAEDGIRDLGRSRGLGDVYKRQLQARGYVTEVARDSGPGQAILFGTTPTFLEKLGINSLADLPPIVEFVPGAEVVEALEHGLRIDPAADARG